MTLDQGYCSDLTRIQALWGWSKSWSASNVPIGPCFDKSGCAWVLCKQAWAWWSSSWSQRPSCLVSVLEFKTSLFRLMNLHNFCNEHIKSHFCAPSLELYYCQGCEPRMQPSVMYTEKYDRKVVLIDAKCCMLRVLGELTAAEHKLGFHYRLAGIKSGDERGKESQKLGTPSP